jgi:hypothetical protein
LSVYFGLSAGLQVLDVSYLSIILRNNSFVSCAVIISGVFGGNSYGGAISLHIGAYSSVRFLDSEAVAHVGDTLARNVTVTLDGAEFKSCSTRVYNTFYGTNTYGGSFSFHVGAYAWSYSTSSSSSSTCGATHVSNATVLVQNVNSFDSIASPISNNQVQDRSYGVNSYGGSMSVFHIGAYSWSSNGKLSNSSSTCAETFIEEVSVQVSDSDCSNCSASISGNHTYGANSYGGSMSVLHVGAYSWSFSDSSSSTCAATSAKEVSVQVSESDCSNCSASTSGNHTYGANSYGGSISVLHIGAYSWSYSSSLSSSLSSSTCRTTNATEVHVFIKHSHCNDCSSYSAGTFSYGTNSYGGSISALYIGAYAYNFAYYGRRNVDFLTMSESTHANHISVDIHGSNFLRTAARSGECCCTKHTHWSPHKLTSFSDSKSFSFGANVSCFVLRLYQRSCLPPHRIFNSL